MIQLIVPNSDQALALEAIEALAPSTKGLADAAKNITLGVGSTLIVSDKLPSGRDLQLTASVVADETGGNT